MSLSAFIRKLTKKNKKIFFITDNSDFQLLDRSLNENRILSIDTEFDWRNTYFPNLSLLQIGFSDEIYILDCLTCDPTKLLKNVLESTSYLKVFHSSRSDATILSKCLGIKSLNCFDIQQGEKLIRGTEIEGYASIVKRYFLTNLDKSQTKSNWLKRPLSAEQIEYASNDVDYLLEIYHVQKNLLDKKNKLKEVIYLTEKEVNLGNEDLLDSRIRKIKKKYSKEYLSIFLWREKIAIQENVPPKKILKDENIKKLIQIIDNNKLKECDWIIKEDKHRFDFLKKFK